MTTSEMEGKLITCFLCGSHPVVVNRRLIPQVIDGRKMTHDFHCQADNKLVYVAD